MFLSLLTETIAIYSQKLFCSNCAFTLKLLSIKYEVGNALVINLVYFQRSRFAIYNFVTRVIKFFGPCPFFLRQILSADVGGHALFPLQINEFHLGLMKIHSVVYSHLLVVAI